MEKRKENEEEFPVANFGARKVKEERELSTGQKQPLLLEMMRRKKVCRSNRVFQGRCIPKKWEGLEITKNENDDKLCPSNMIYQGRCMPE